MSAACWNLDYPHKSFFREAFESFLVILAKSIGRNLINQREVNGILIFKTTSPKISFSSSRQQKIHCVVSAVLCLNLNKINNKQQKFS